MPRRKALVFVVSQNLQRRHLTSDQRAAIAADAVELVDGFRADALKRQQDGRVKGGGPPGRVKKLTQAVNQNRVDHRIAKIFKTNRGYVAQARKLRERDRKAFGQVKAGTKRLSQVVRENKQKVREQKRAENAAAIRVVDKWERSTVRSTGLRGASRRDWKNTGHCALMCCPSTWPHGRTEEQRHGG